MSDFLHRPQRKHFFACFNILSLLFVFFVFNPKHAYADCTINAPTFTFGDYNPLFTDPLEAIGSIDFQCSPNTLNVQISLTNLTSGCSTTNLCMSSGSDHIPYVLFLNAAHTVIWGNGTNNAQVYSNATPTPNTTITVPFYGQINPQQNNPATLHTGTILATLSWNTGTVTTTFSTQAQVIATCLFPTASSVVDFGPLNTILGTVTATGSITVQCTRDILAKIGLDNGLNAIGGQRKLKDSSTNTIDYSLFQDAAHAIIWGTSDPNRISLTATGTNQTLPIHGTLNYNTLVPGGLYNDTIIAIVEF